MSSFRRVTRSTEGTWRLCWAGTTTYLSLRTGPSRTCQRGMTFDPSTPRRSGCLTWSSMSLKMNSLKSSLKLMRSSCVIRLSLTSSLISRSLIDGFLIRESPRLRLSPVAGPHDDREGAVMLHLETPPWRAYLQILTLRTSEKVEFASPRSIQ